MSQQINFINPSLFKQQSYLTLKNVGLIYLLLAVILMGRMLYTEKELGLLMQQRNALMAGLVQGQAALEQIIERRKPHDANKAIQQEAEQLERKYQLQTQLLQVMNQGVDSSHHGLSAYMRGFAQQAMTGLWVTGFDIDETHRTMSVYGRTVQADYLPRYIQALAKDEVFAGHAFGGLHIQATATPTVTKAADEHVDATKAEVAVATPSSDKNTLVDFELQALDKSNKPKSNEYGL